VLLSTSLNLKLLLNNTLSVDLPFQKGRKQANKQTNKKTKNPSILYLWLTEYINMNSSVAFKKLRHVIFLFLNSKNKTFILSHYLLRILYKNILFTQFVLLSQKQTNKQTNKQKERKKTKQIKVRFTCTEV
jgi:archaellum biogenesis protein FlaJ (TadC family)